MINFEVLWYKVYFTTLAILTAVPCAIFTLIIGCFLIIISAMVGIVITRRVIKLIIKPIKKSQDPIQDPNKGLN